MLNMFTAAQKARKKAKVLVYGDAGTGKTQFALSWPGVALIDTEGGADLYGGRFNFQVLRTKSLTDVVSAIEAVKQDKGKTVQTLVIDPITVIWQVLQEAGQQAAENRAAKYKSDTSNVALTPRDWGIIKRRLYSAMIDAVNLDANFIMTAHIKDMTETRRDDRGQEVQVKIGEKDDAEKKTRYWCDVVIRLAVEKGEHVGYVEKDRSGLFKVGQRIPNISYEHFKPLLEAHASGAVVTQPKEEVAIKQDVALMVEDAPAPRVTVKLPVDDDAADIDEAEGYSQGDDAPAAAYPDVELPADIPTVGPRFFETVNAHRVQLGRAPYDALYGLQRVLSAALPDGFNWNMLRDEGARVLAYRAAMAHVRSSEKVTA